MQADKTRNIFRRKENVRPKTEASIVVARPGLQRNPDMLMQGFRDLSLVPGDRSGRSEYYRIYERMMLDDRVSQVVSVVNSAVLSLAWRIESDDPSVSAFVKSCLEGIGVRRFLGNLLEARVFGFAAFEEVWSLDDGLYRLKEERYLPYERVEFAVDRFGNLESVHFDGEPHPADWFHVFTYPEIRPGNLHYGVSDLRQVYREWFTKDVLKRYRNLGLENFAYPLMVVTYDENRYRPGTRQWEELSRLVEGYKDDARVALPAGVNAVTGEIAPGVRIEFLEPQFSGGGFEAFESAIESENRAIARNLGLPDDLGFTESGSGSYAKAVQEFEIFWRVVCDIASLVEASVQSVVERIAAYNFPDAKARFLFDTTQDKGLSESKASALKLLKEAGIAVTDEFVASYLGMGK